MNSPSTSAFNIPEISLDFSEQISDLGALKTLEYLATPPSCELAVLVSRIKENPTDLPLQTSLSAYLYNRYKVTAEYAQRLQSEPCYVCLETSDALKKLYTAARGVDVLQKDLYLILDHSFIYPGNYATCIPAAATDSYNQLQQLRDGLGELSEQCSAFLSDQAKSQPQPIRSPVEALKALRSAQILAFNRAVELLTEKDYENAVLAYELKQARAQEEENYVLISQLQLGEKRLNQQLAAYYQSLDQQRQQLPQRSHSAYLAYSGYGHYLTQTRSGSADQRSTAFVWLLRRQMAYIPVPLIQKDFLNDKFAQPRTTQKSLLEILQEAAYLLSYTLGSNDVRIEQARFDPRTLDSELSQEEAEALEDMNRVISLTVLLRFYIEACLSAAGTDAKQPQPYKSTIQSVYLDVAPETLNELKATLYQALQGLFYMAAPPNAATKTPGSCTNEELYYLVNDARPEGFYDAQFLQNANYCCADIAVEPTLNDLVSDYYVFLYAIKAASRRCKLVQSYVVSVAESAFGLEKDLKDRYLHIDYLHQEMQELKTLHNDQMNFIYQLQTYLKAKENDVSALQTQLNAQKNDNLELRVENERIPGLEEYCKQAKRDVEQLKFYLAYTEQQYKNAEQQIAYLNAEMQKKATEIYHLTGQISQNTLRIHSLEADLKDLQEIKQSTVAKNRELLTLARDLEQQLTQAEADIVSLKQTISRDMPTLEKNAETYQTLMRAAQDELLIAKDDLRKTRESEKDFKIAKEAQDARLYYTAHDNAELRETANRLELEYKQIYQEADHFADLLSKEQQKSYLLGENLDQISALNLQLEKQKAELIAEVEVLRAELNEQNSILQEVNLNYQTYKKEAEELRSQFVYYQQSIYNSLQQTSAADAKTQMLQQQNQRFSEINEELSNQLKAKQALIDQQQHQLAGLTMNTLGNETQLKTLLKSNFEREIQEVIQTQRGQHQEQLSALESERTYLLSDYQQLRIESSEAQKELARAKKENQIFNSQLQQLQEIQTKLANKSKKLLKTTNVLKQKTLQFASAFERISAYSQGNAHYAACLSSSRQDATLSAASLAQTAPADEIHASDAVKIQMVTEDFLKAVCDLMTAGLGAEQLKMQLQTEKSAASASADQAVQEARREAENAALEAERISQALKATQQAAKAAGQEANKWQAKYQEMKQQNQAMNNTIAMLSGMQAPHPVRQIGQMVGSRLGTAAQRAGDAESAGRVAPKLEGRSFASANAAAATVAAAGEYSQQSDNTYEERAVNAIIYQQRIDRRAKSQAQDSSAAQRRRATSANESFSRESSVTGEPQRAFAEPKNEQGSAVLSPASSPGPSSTQQPELPPPQREKVSQAAKAVAPARPARDAHHFEPSDSAEQQIFNILQQYQPAASRNAVSEQDEAPERLTPPHNHPMLVPTSVNLTAYLADTPQIGAQFDESVRSFQNRRSLHQNARDVSMLSDEERLMIQRLLQQ